MLDDLGDFAAACAGNTRCYLYNNGFRSFTASEMFCPQCGDARRMTITPIWVRSFEYPNGPTTRDQFISYLQNTIHEMHCVQCGTAFTAVGYKGPEGMSLAVFPTVYGGARTPNTPDGVAFYLDQAQRAKNVGAYSAAVAMYRGALEQFLFQQGFQKGMLANKINELVQAVKDGKAPKWAMEIDDKFLTVLKDLGNGSIHPNDGDITKQAALDNSLVDLLGVVFQSVLYYAYEVKAKGNAALAELQKRAAMLKK